MAKATNNPTHIIVHHTAVSYTKNPQQFNATNNHHKGQGFARSSKGLYVGYHAMVEMNGDVRIARADTELGQHTYQENMNVRSLGICFTGNFDMEEPTIEQCRAALQWITGKQEAYQIPDSKVVPHRHFAPKSCWGNKLPDDILGYLRQRVGDAAQAPSNWAVASFEKAKALGFSDSNPREIVGTARLRYMMNKEHGKLVIAEKDAPVTYEEWIHAKAKAGIFDKS